MENFYYLVIYFFIYAVLGTVMEILTIYVEEKKLVLNRGYLIGPYIPIYGFGGLIIILFLSSYESDFFILFGMSLLLCGILEYLVSYLLEKIFNMKWWDYSHTKFNINGRVELSRLISFGIMGVVVIKLFQPFFTGILDSFSSSTIMITAIVLLVILITDFIISTITTVKLKNKIKVFKNLDVTKEIKDEINKFVYKRLLKTFPYLKKYFDH